MGGLRPAEGSHRLIPHPCQVHTCALPHVGPPQVAVHCHVAVALGVLADALHWGNVLQTRGRCLLLLTQKRLSYAGKPAWLNSRRAQACMVKTLATGGPISKSSQPCLKAVCSPWHQIPISYKPSPIYMWSAGLDLIKDSCRHTRS